MEIPSTLHCRAVLLNRNIDEPFTIRSIGMVRKIAEKYFS